MDEIIPQYIIEQKIFIIRGKKVMLDSDLAELYEVPTRRLTEQFSVTYQDFPLTLCFS